MIKKQQKILSNDFNYTTHFTDLDHLDFITQ